MSDGLERSFVMMNPEAYKELIETRFANIAAVPSIDAEMLQYLFKEEELQWLKEKRAISR